nr:auxilin-like protein [Tanacetum cinerariifolium]
MSNKKRSLRRQVKVPLKYTDHVVGNLSQTRNEIIAEVDLVEIRAQSGENKPIEENEKELSGEVFEIPDLGVYSEENTLMEYRTILKYRLMILLFSVDEICPVCRKACLDSFREHAVHCKELPGFKYRHDIVRGVFFNICRRAGISTKKEAHVNFLTNLSDGRSTLRPDDVLVFGWVRGKHACVDLTGVSPLVGLRSKGFTTGQTALKPPRVK